MEKRQGKEDGRGDGLMTRTGSSLIFGALVVTWDSNDLDLTSQRMHTWIDYLMY